MSFVSGRLLPDGESRCDKCSHHSRCLSLGLEGEAKYAFDSMLERSRQLKRGEDLAYEEGRFTSLYVVQTGSLKQVVSQVGARDQVTHFYLPGDLVGLDGIGDGRCGGKIIALESTFVCELPFSKLESLLQNSCALRSRLFHSMGTELRNDRRMMCLLSGHTADQRLASFLLEFSERFKLRGYSPTCFNLSMSRADIGSYLGLAIETVSRVLGRFQKQELIMLKGRQVTLLTLTGLCHVVEDSLGRHSGF
ncbi:MAG: helix-turn-helix domain-containing protein [Halomonas sp.]|nr:helix-turn-helix domain-containing protein [Halomonas sp.]MCC5884794.1 helix-turn-helix domain-containing protein [Halomonas sp.]